MKFPGYEVNQRSPVWWVIVIGVGIFAISPLLAIGFKAVSAPFPEFISVAIVSGLLVAAAIQRRQLTVPATVGVVILSTINANFPLPIVQGNYSTPIVGSLFLVHFPIVILVAQGLYQGWHRHLDRVPLMLGGFAIASGLGTIFGPRPEPIPGIFFFAFAITLGLLVWILQSIVREEVISATELLYVFLISVFGHALFATMQLLNQSSFGLTRIGEGAGEASVIPVTGSLAIKIGPYVSGLTGMSFQLSVLALMALPLCFGLALETDHRPRLYYGFSVLLAVIIRASASDAARGALLLILPMIMLILWYYRDEITRTHAQSAAIVFVIVVLVALVPSTASGTAGEIVTNAEGSSSGKSTQTLSLPFFDTSNLGGRTLQYAVAIDLWRQYPLFGIGGMNYAHLAVPYGVPLSHVGGHAYLIHNLILAVLTESGIIGAVCYFGSIVTAIGSGLRNNWSIINLSAVVGIIGVFGYAFWHPFLYSFIGQFGFWIVIVSIAEARKQNNFPGLKKVE